YQLSIISLSKSVYSIGLLNWRRIKMKKIKLDDVAKHSKVSKSTVSQYINGRYNYMSESTQKRIEKSINELNYQASEVERSLKKRRTYTIGVIVANILHTFSTQVIRAIEYVCNKHDMSV